MVVTIVATGFVTKQIINKLNKVSLTIRDFSIFFIIKFIYIG
jgi:hypothetical protein